MIPNKIIGDEACPSCREQGGDKSGNHLMIFEDGGKYCNRCKYSERPNQEEEEPMVATDVDNLGYHDYRGIKARYMEMYGARVECDTSNGEPTSIYYPLTKGGDKCGTKRRHVDHKNFVVIGQGKDADLFGMDVSGGTRLCIITEGENDAIAAKQMLGDGNNWYDNEPRDYTVVSVPFGSNSKINKYSYEWLSRFETIIIATDMDEPGEGLSQSINDMFPPHTCKRAIMSVKDAHECLEQGMGVDFVNSIRNARTIVADGIVMGDDSYERMLEAYRKNPDGGIPYPPMFGELNEMVYGIRTGELDLFTSGSGMGKSQKFHELLHYLTNEIDSKVGCLILEEDITDTLIKQLSITDNRPLHLPEVKSTVSDDDLRSIYDKTSTHNLVLYDHFGGLAEDTLTGKIRYMAVALGCQYIMLDHISIVISDFAAEGDERRMIDQLMTHLARLAKELDIWIGVISHLRKTSSGPSFEEGAVPSLDDLRGSGSLKQLSFQVIALSRNQQDPCPIKRNTTQVTVLKNRFCGRTGPAGRVYYDHDTGRMSESTLTDEEWHDSVNPLEQRL